MARRVRVALILAGLFVLTAPLDARAQSATTADHSAEARSLFERGVQLSAQERWGEALDYFQRSRALVERPNTVFNLATTLVRLGRLVEARVALQDYLRISDASRDQATRADAQRMIDNASSAIATLALAVTPADADVRIDGRATLGTGAARAIELDPGTHTLTISQRGYVTSTTPLSAGPAERMSRAIALAPLSTTGAISITAAPITATIRIDGRLVGIGSYSDALEPGSHIVEVTADGFEATRRPVVVARGDNIVIHAALSRQRNFLTSPAFLGTAGGVVVVGVVAAVLAVVLTPPSYARGSTGTLISVPP
jgi:hypothetical protein